MQTLCFSGTWISQVDVGVKCLFSVDDTYHYLYLISFVTGKVPQRQIWELELHSDTNGHIPGGTRWTGVQSDWRESAGAE